MRTPLRIGMRSLLFGTVLGGHWRRVEPVRRECWPSSSIFLHDNLALPHDASNVAHAESDLQKEFVYERLGPNVAVSIHNPERK